MTARGPRLAIFASHPVQYQAPLFRALARVLDIEVLFAHRATPQDQARAGFGVAFDWDVNLTDGYSCRFLRNVAARPSADRFFGCDTPTAGAALREGGFDAALVMGWGLKSYVQATLAAKRLGLPVLARSDSHLGTPRAVLRRSAKALVYPGLLRAFDAALCVGRRSREYFLNYRFPPARLFFAPHGVDSVRFAAGATPRARASTRARIGLADDAGLILFAGKLVAHKRPEDALRAVSRLRAQGRRLEIAFAGDGPLRAELERLASALATPAHFLGFVNQSAMPAVYAAADLLALPSESETWGVVANEALACGRPLVVSEACGCAPDLVRCGAGGRGHPVGDVAALADAAAAVLDRPPKPEALAALSARFSTESAVEGVRAALDAARASR